MLVRRVSLLHDDALVQLPQSPRSWWETSSPRRPGCGVWSTAAAWWPAHNTPANAAPAPEAQTHRGPTSSRLCSISRCPFGRGGGLTLALTPSWASGTLGMTSYREETYVMMDFSSGWGTSTSGERDKKKGIENVLKWLHAISFHH